LAQKDDKGRLNYYLHNAHGDVTSLIDASGKVLNSYQYDAFGNTTSSVEAVVNRFKYAGEQLDPITGQYYLRARYYDPTVGRFTQEDTYRGDGLNLYSYVGNNPVKYVDPSGLCKDEIIAAVDEHILYNPNISEAAKKQLRKMIGKETGNGTSAVSNSKQLVNVDKSKEYSYKKWGNENANASIGNAEAEAKLTIDKDGLYGKLGGEVSAAQGTLCTGEIGTDWANIKVSGTLKLLTGEAYAAADIGTRGAGLGGKAEGSVAKLELPIEINLFGVNIKAKPYVSGITAQAGKRWFANPGKGKIGFGGSKGFGWYGGGFEVDIEF
jgi:RHS repeat-associated protein